MSERINELNLYLTLMLRV